MLYDINGHIDDIVYQGDFLDLLADYHDNPCDDTANRLAGWCLEYGGYYYNGDVYDISGPDCPTGSSSLRLVYDGPDDDGDFLLVKLEVL